MKRDILRAAACLLTPEEQEMLLRLGDATEEDGPVVAIDMDIRTGMCASLADMGNAISALINLLEQNRVADTLPESARVRYGEIMARISNAATQATTMVDRSRAFDEDAFMVLASEGTYITQ